MKLYKYRPINDHTIDIFRNRKIYFPKLSEFNDPFDCHFKLEKKMTGEERVKYLDGVAEKNELIRNELINRYGEFLKGFFNNFGILSLTEIKDNILMWSHYTKDHKGVCIEFDIPESEYSEKINYFLNCPIIFLADLLGENGKEKEKFLKVTGTKAIYWEYEQERKFYSDIGSREVDFKDFNGEITAVYFGCKCEDEDIKEIVNLCKDFKDCKFYKYKKSDSAYKLEIDEKYFK